ncbi:MAG: PAS domain-containing protein, partial [Rhodocyclaceae bacterium]|nr:PAS domain-containing protein [Rhodocyclaceae bacterium]
MSAHGEAPDHAAPAAGASAGGARALRANAAVAALIFAAAGLASALSSAFPAGVAWPLLGLNLGALGWRGAALLPGVILGSALAALFAGAPGAATVVELIACAVLPAVAVAPLLRASILNGRFCTHAQGAVSLVLLGGVLAAGLSALVQFGVSLAHGADLVNALDALPAGWIANSSAVLLITPLLCDCAGKRAPPHIAGYGEALLAALFAAAFGALGFGISWHPLSEAYLSQFLVLPVLVWGAIRLSRMGVQFVLLAFGLSALAVSALAAGQAGAGLTPEALLKLHLFIVMAAALVLLIHGSLAEHRREEARLVASERHFRTLVQASCDVYWDLDANLRFTLYVDLQKSSSERSEDPTVYGLHPWELPGREAVSADWDSMRRMLEAHEPFRDFVLRYRESPERWRYLRVAGAPIFDAAGQFTGYRGLAQDASDQMRAQEAVQRSQFELRALLDASPDWVVMKNRSGEWLVANQAIMSAFSLRESDWRGRSPDELLLVAPQLHELLVQGQDSDREVLQDGRLQHIEQVLTLSDGLRRSFDILKAPLRNHSGDITGLVVIGRDITHLKQSERIRRKQMEEIQRLNSELESRVRARTAQLEAANSEL